MPEAGDKIKAAIERHNAAIEASRSVAGNIAAEREAAVKAAVDGGRAPHPSPSYTDEGKAGQ